MSKSAKKPAIRPGFSIGGMGGFKNNSA